MIAADLTPGDRRSAGSDWSEWELHDIRSPADPHFSMAYGALKEEFGASDEVESEEIFHRRLERDPLNLIDGCFLLYRLLLIRKNGEFAGVRDHTAIVKPNRTPVVVHLSHNLVAPAYRRSGIAGWLRALPLQTAREALAIHGLDRITPVRLVAEMEPADPASEARVIRLRAYEKSGFRKIDPAAIPYAQPDFRDPAEIDRTGGPRPLPLNLLVRPVGAATSKFETSLPAEEVRHLADSLYRMYAADFRADDMAPLFARLADYPPDGTSVPLFPPTSVA